MARSGSQNLGNLIFVDFEFDERVRFKVQVNPIP
jgi:hypothetical protein